MTDRDELRLQELLDTMDVPALRRTDIRWLMRNLHVNNSDNPNFDEAELLIGRLFRHSLKGN